MSYVDDSIIIVQSSTWGKNLTKPKSAYKVVFELMESLGLILEHTKSEVFHFSRLSGDLNPPVDLGFAPFMDNTSLTPNTFWRYLGFFFDRVLFFWEHTKQYTNKALKSVMAMLRLGNSVHGLTPKHQRLLYYACVLLITTYGMCLWNYKGFHNKGPSNC